MHDLSSQNVYISLGRNGEGVWIHASALIEDGLSHGGNYRPAVSALISVDAPLDIERWYRGMDLFVRRTSPDNPFFGECQFLTGMFREMFGGTPEEKPAAYWEHSILTASEADGGNAAYFRRMPMRLYAEPDMDYFVRYGVDYTAINASDQVSMASVLKTLGNDQVSRSHFRERLSRRYGQPAHAALMVDRR